MLDSLLVTFVLLFLTLILIQGNCKGFQAIPLAHAVILLSCVQEVPGLNVSLDSEFLTKSFLGFT